MNFYDLWIFMDIQFFFGGFDEDLSWSQVHRNSDMI